MNTKNYLIYNSIIKLSRARQIKSLCDFYKTEGVAKSNDRADDCFL